jgi:hypothetical protein
VSKYIHISEKYYGSEGVQYYLDEKTILYDSISMLKLRTRRCRKLRIKGGFVVLRIIKYLNNTISPLVG